MIFRIFIIYDINNILAGLYSRYDNNLNNPILNIILIMVLKIRYNY